MLDTFCILRTMQLLLPDLRFVIDLPGRLVRIFGFAVEAPGRFTVLIFFLLHGVSVNEETWFPLTRTMRPSSKLPMN